MTANVLQLEEVGDFEARNYLPALDLIRSTKLHLITEPPISFRWQLFYSFSLFVFVCLSHSSKVIIPNSGCASPSKIEINSTQCPSGSSK